MKDFGKWMGEQGPLDFKDPGELVPPKKPKFKPQPLPDEQFQQEYMISQPRRGGKTVHDAIQELFRLGFKPDTARDTMVRPCNRCGVRVEVGMLEALDRVYDHHLRGIDVTLCRHCQQPSSYQYRRYP